MVLRRLNIYFDVVILTECWLNEITIIPTIENYNFTSSTNHINQASGVVVYYRNDRETYVHEPKFREAN